LSKYEEIIAATVNNTANSQYTEGKIILNAGKIIKRTTAGRSVIRVAAKITAYDFLFN